MGGSRPTPPLSKSSSSQPPGKATPPARNCSCRDSGKGSGQCKHGRKHPCKEIHARRVERDKPIHCNRYGSNSIINAYDVTVNPAAVLTATGGGNIHAQGFATINGTVDVHGGTMRVGSLDATLDAPTGAVTVGNGGRLFGKGTIKGNLFGRHSFFGR